MINVRGWHGFLHAGGSFVPRASAGVLRGRCGRRSPAAGRRSLFRQVDRKLNWCSGQERPSLTAPRMPFSCMLLAGVQAALTARAAVLSVQTAFSFSFFVHISHTQMRAPPSSLLKYFSCRCSPSDRSLTSSAAVAISSWQARRRPAVAELGLLVARISSCHCACS